MALTQRRRAWILGVGLPLGVVEVMSLFMRPEPGSVLAPLFGPWAGLLYGHSDCTMGNQAPVASVVLLVLGGAALAGAARAERRGVFASLMSLSVASCVCWGLAALLSIANTLQ